MKTFSDLRQIIDQAASHYDSLNRIAKDELKETGYINPDTCRRINAIIYSISNAYDCIDKGLDGEF